MVAAEPRVVVTRAVAIESRFFIVILARQAMRLPHAANRFDDDAKRTHDAGPRNIPRRVCEQTRHAAMIGVVLVHNAVDALRQRCERIRLEKVVSSLNLASLVYPL